MSWPHAWRRPLVFDRHVNTYRSRFNLLLWLLLATAAATAAACSSQCFPEWIFVFYRRTGAHSPHSILNGSNLFLHSARLT